MKILVLGGTRFFGIPMVNELLAQGHEVTIATRGTSPDPFGDRVQRIVFQRADENSVREALTGTHYDVVIDKIAYCSNDIRYVMDAVDCDRYIHMSSTSVYDPKRMNTVESDFDAVSKKLIWCDRAAFPYDEIKRQAECALWQKYPDRNWIAVRYPFVLGEDDYTKRVLFYVEHAMRGIPMFIDNVDAQMGFIRADEAGLFLAHLAGQDLTGAVNGSAHGTISVREMLDYVEQKTGAKAILAPDGDEAPYNDEPAYSINTDRAESTGFRFSNLKDWIYELLDYYIDQVKEKQRREMLRLRPYKSGDAKYIEQWVQDRDIFLMWGGDRFGEFPISAQIIDDKYRLNNGDCAEPDNFYPWTAFTDEDGVVGHFIMRYLNGDNRVLRFGWVIVDNTIRGKGFGARMLRAGLKYAFEVLGVDVVTIGVYEDNVRAHRCYQKVGFRDREIVTYEGRNIIEMEIKRD